MKSFDKLVSCLKRLPGIGPKQAERLAIHLLRTSHSEAQAFSEAILRAKKEVRPCRLCQNYTEKEECRICGDPGREIAVRILRCFRPARPRAIRAALQRRDPEAAARRIPSVWWMAWVMSCIEGLGRLRGCLEGRR